MRETIELKNRTLVEHFKLVSTPLIEIATAVMSLMTLWTLTAHAQTFTLNAACAPHDETDVNTVQCQSWCQYSDRTPRQA